MYLSSAVLLPSDPGSYGAALLHRWGWPCLGGSRQGGRRGGGESRGRLYGGRPRQEGVALGGAKIRRGRQRQLYRRHLGNFVNQFLSIYVSKNQDFRNIAFAFLFTNGASEELSALQAVEAHAFPPHFSEMKKTSQVQLPFYRCKEILG